jgi:hypothetical protein
MLVFDGAGALLRFGPEVAELTGHTAETLWNRDAWCAALFPDPTAQSIVQGAFAAMATAVPAGEPRSFEFSLPYCTAEGDLRQGQFVLALAPQPGESPEAVFVVSLQEKGETRAVNPREGRDLLGQSLGEIQEAQRGLLAILEESQARVIAATNRIRGDQAALSHQWDDLFQEAFALARVRDLVTSIGESVDTALEASRSDVRQADPDRPLVGVPLGRPVALPLGLSLHKLERFWILSTLQALHGNRSDCARHLDIALRTVRNKLGEYKSAGFKVPASARGRRAKVTKGA